MWTRKMLKTRAKEVLKIAYWKLFLVSLIIAFVGGDAGGGGSFNFNWKSGGQQAPSGGGGDLSLEWLIFIVIGVIGILLIVLAFRILLGYALEVGGRRYFIQATQNDFDLNALGFAFEKPKYLNIIKAMLWRALLNFLWLLLLIIPGIVKYYAYRMVPYILADNPNIGYKRALELSVQMTKGHKFDIFVLDLSFIGWYLLGTLALLIGVLFVLPYVNATNAELYLVLRQNALDSGLCGYEELNA
ncbi:MAG: DUF975 family protein [Carboxydocellales bacterium]